MLISTLNCEMWPNFSYRGVRSVELLLLLLLLMVFSSENFGFSPPYAGITGIGPGKDPKRTLPYYLFLKHFVFDATQFFIIVSINHEIQLFKTRK